MMIYKPYDVVVVPFPFTDIKQVKKRPALVLSSSQFQQKNKHVTLLMITSALHTQWYEDHQITDLKSTGLKADSIIRQKVFTVDRRVILKKIGCLSKGDKVALATKLASHLPKF
jgi:mRNA-degrading endonuclease toxin of MazEF toxin-antitoxin module